MMPAEDKTPAIVVTGLNHRTAGIDTREKFAVDSSREGEALREILRIPQVCEAVVVSTCNRVEIVTAQNANNGEREVIEQVFEKLSGVPRHSFSNGLYHLDGKQAVEHVFRVASGLDSMIVGEPQILGQLKRAYLSAHAQGATRGLLNRLFQTAFAVAKLVRSKTNIGRHAVSVCYAARELARQVFGDLSTSSVMIIGAGDTGELALKHFHSAGVRKFFVVNRTLARALELANRFDGVPIQLANCNSFLPQADIIIGASTLGISTPGKATQLQIEASHVSDALRERSGRPQFFIDLGVPRNFSSAISDVDGAFLYSMDELQAVVEKNMDARLLEIDQANVMLEAEVLRFCHWLSEREIDPALRALSEKITIYRDEEVSRTLRRLKRINLSDEQLAEAERALADMSDALMAKTLHQPISVLKKKGVADELLLKNFWELFVVATPSRRDG